MKTHRLMLPALLVAIVALPLTFAVVALAQEADSGKVPAPYAGLTNPFPWGDASAAKGGEGIFNASCSGCHGPDGNRVSVSPLATREVSAQLREKPDYYFWSLSEGRLAKGMPPYKALLAEDQRWQVLTYLEARGNSEPKTEIPVETPVGTKTPEATPEPKPEPTPEPSPEPKPEPTAGPTTTPTPKATATPAASPEPSPIPTPARTPTATPGPAPAQTPEASPSPSPAETPVPGKEGGSANPFDWEDASAQAAGGRIYSGSCSGCHGADGKQLPSADLGSADFAKRLEEHPEPYFQVVREGRLERGMPPFKSSLSERETWQVITYMRSLGIGGKGPATSAPTVPIGGEKPAVGSLVLTTSEGPRMGVVSALTAILRDAEGSPIPNANVKFSLEASFFATGLMEIGEASTDERGAAVFEYVFRQAGTRQAVARYGDVESRAEVLVSEGKRIFYEPEAGLHLPSPGDAVLLGPASAQGLGPHGDAPTSAFRLPGGILSWVLLLVGTIMLIWITYFRVIYQVFRIPGRGDAEDAHTRLVPIVGMAVIVFLGILLVVVAITGPYTHFNLHQ